MNIPPVQPLIIISILITSIISLPSIPSAETKPSIIAERIETGRISIDGRLDETEWQKAKPVTGFVQREPRPGSPATERTEVKVLFDRDNLYIGAILYDSSPKDIIADEMRRDADFRRNDAFAVIIDTYHDHRNGFFFETNPLGARADALNFDEGDSIDFDWDGVWWAAARITEKGWQVELRIPFTTLRYESNKVEAWGIQFRRIIKHKDEEVYWPVILLNESIWDVSRAGHLKGLRDIKAGRNIEIKPYIIAGAERLPSKGEGTEAVKDAGLDVKYGIDPNLTLDLTYNTDFAQVEVDEEQVNLTRFPLFFPEKRDFFLERSGFFDFGISGKIQPFFSRRIGLVGGEEIPILFGIKLTGKKGRYGIGLLSVETRKKGDEPETNYSVIRLKRGLLENSNMGFILVNKEPSHEASNITLGIDADITLFEKLELISFLMSSRTQGAGGSGNSGYLKLRWDDERRLFTLSYLDVEDDLDPEVGFVRRSGIKETIGHASIDMRPEASVVREVTPFVDLNYTMDRGYRPVTNSITPGVTIDLHSGDSFYLSIKRRFERLDEGFEIHPDVIIPTGDYSFYSVTGGVDTDSSRKLSGSLNITGGEFFSGHILSYDASMLIKPSTRTRVELEFSRDDVDLPQGSFATDLLITRWEYTFSTNSFINAIIQWNDDTDELISNLRFTYEYMPGSDIFLVYNERRDTGGDGVTDRSILFKLTYLLGM